MQRWNRMIILKSKMSSLEKRLRTPTMAPKIAS